MTLPFIQTIKRSLLSLEISYAVLWGLLSKSWTLASGPITVILIASHFTPEVQGFYYTYGSLMALSIFAELGLGTVIINFASHEWAGLSLASDGHITGNRDSLARLSCLSRLALKWFSIAGTIFLMLIGVGGYFFFCDKPTEIQWLASWLALCFATTVNLFFIPLWFILEGCNQVSEIYKIRFLSGILSTIALWGMILCNGKLWSSPVSLMAAMLFSNLYLVIRYRHFFNDLFTFPCRGDELSWWGDLFPVQWRIAISWLSGYLSYYLFIPILFKFHGPEVAGKMGMTWSIISTVTAISNAWVAPQIPKFGILLARNENKQLDSLLKRITAITFAVGGIVSILIELLVVLLFAYGHRFAERLLSPASTGLFLLGNMVLIVIIPLAGYLRAHREEPLLITALASGVLISLSNVILGYFYSAQGMAFGYLASQLLILPPTFYIFFQYRRNRQTAPAEPAN